MSLASGTRLGPYEVLGLIGAGGMGEVYQARDTRLDRTVAVKVLPPELSADPDRRARFEREARAVAALAHPHICTLFDIGEAVPAPCPLPLVPVHFLVMEHLAGQTLAERLARGALPLGEALELATQIADALDAAHRQGIIHRDLKPGNVMLTTGGPGRSGRTMAKLLDFGLARLAEHGAADGREGASAVSTLTDSLTVRGTVMGTLPYMAPELLEGKRADARSDLWALGTMIYEMLTGRRAFAGDSQASLIGSIMNTEPPALAEQQPLTPPALEHVVRKCLAKRPDDRWDSAHDVADELRWIAQTTAARAHRPSPVRAALPWALAAIGAAAVVLAAAVWRPWRAPAQAGEGRPLLRLTIDLPADAPLAPAGAMPLGIGRPAIAFSPDGRLLAYVAWAGGRTTLFLRNMATGEIKPVAGSEDARSPFFSPDGRWVGFSAGTTLKKASLDGGAPVPVADVSSGDSGAVWGTDGRIYFSSFQGEGIYAVADAGGPAAPVTQRRLTAWRGYACPEWLPNGALMVGSSSWSDIGVLVPGEPGARPRSLGLQNASSARYMPTGYLLFATPGRLNAIRFDIGRLRILGNPVVLADDLRTEEQGTGQFSLSADGTLAYVSGEHATVGSFVWRDRRGRTTPVGLPRRQYGAFSLSHDGRRMAYVITDAMGRRDVSVYDFGGRETRVTADGHTSGPAWFPDDTGLILHKFPGQFVSAYQQPLEGGQGATPLTESTADSMVYFFTPDGREMFVGYFPYYRIVPAMKPVGMGQDAARRIDLSQERSMGQFMAIHPSGGLFAFTSSQYDRDEIVVRTFPALDWRKQVTSNGGEEPRWSPGSGHELIYRWGSQWYAIDVRLGPKPEFGVPRKLFDGPYINVPGYSWDISPDAQRFLLLENLAHTTPSTRIVVMTNVGDELQRRLPRRE